MKLGGRKILVVGMGVSGLAAADYARRQGAVVTVVDRHRTPDLQAKADQLGKTGIQVYLGPHEDGHFIDNDLVVLSPGVPHTLAPIQRAQARGVTVIGELELACRMIDRPIVAITGTNGKSTVTELIGAMLAESGRKVFLGGNLGPPLIGYVSGPEKVDVVVAEVSSFQLDTVEQFHANVSVLLNISEDHLDRYPDLFAYAQSKGKIFMNQTTVDTAVFNAGDAAVCALADTIDAKRLTFNHRGRVRCPQKMGVEIDGRNLSFRNLGEKVPETLSPSEALFPGQHGMENVAAAALAAFSIGATAAGVQSALNKFVALSHRLETVATIDGIRWVNDSKATNVDATAKALTAFEQPVILIMGGRDKGGHFDQLRSLVRSKVKKLIVIGEAADTIAAELEPVVSTHRAASMRQAVWLAHDFAEADEVVLLAPACASFDMYSSYSQRGNDFRREVEALK